MNNTNYNWMGNEEWKSLSKQDHSCSPTELVKPFLLGSQESHLYEPNILSPP